MYLKKLPLLTLFLAIPALTPSTLLAAPETILASFKNNTSLRICVEHYVPDTLKRKSNDLYSKSPAIKTHLALGPWPIFNNTNPDSKEFHFSFKIADYQYHASQPSDGILKIRGRKISKTSTGFQIDLNVAFNSDPKFVGIALVGGKKLLATITPNRKNPKQVKISFNWE